MNTHLLVLEAMERREEMPPTEETEVLERTEELVEKEETEEMVEEAAMLEKSSSRASTSLRASRMSEAWAVWVDRRLWGDPEELVGMEAKQESRVLGEKEACPETEGVSCERGRRRTRIMRSTPAGAGGSAAGTTEIKRCITTMRTIPVQCRRAVRAGRATTGRTGLLGSAVSMGTPGQPGRMEWTELQGTMGRRTKRL